MLVKLQVLSSKSSHVNDTEQIGFVRLDRKVHVLSFIDQGSIWNGFRAAVKVVVEWRLVVLYEVRCFLMIPICEGDDDLLIDLGGKRRGGVMNNKWAT